MDVQLHVPTYTFDSPNNTRTFVKRDGETIGWFDRRWQGDGYDATANPGQHRVAHGVTQAKAIEAICAHYVRRTS